MTSFEDVDAIARELPQTTVGESRGRKDWRVGDKMFAWERPFSKADIKRFGDETPPQGDILGVRVADLADKEAVLAEGHTGVFTIPHFNGYAALLVQLSIVDREVLRALGAMLIVNDRLDLAAALRADGIHLGRSSVQIDEARAFLGPRVFVSVACHTVEEVAAAAEKGANAALLSPIFFSPGKGPPLGPAALSEAKELLLARGVAPL